MTQQPLTPAQDPNYFQLQVIPALKSKMKGGINWFYWIAGLSILNSLLNFFKADMSFVFGLGATQFIDAILRLMAEDVGTELSPVTYGLGFGINIFIAALFVVAGILGNKRHAWAVIVGMALYLLDGVLLVSFQIWLDAGFHLFALYGLFRGLRALYQLKKLETPPDAAVVPILP